MLTDPVLSARIGPRIGSQTFGLAREAPAIAIVELPRIDVVLVSHAHFDHLDRPTLRALAHKGCVVVTARGTRGLIPRGFGEVVELDEGACWSDEALSVRAFAVAHWGARFGVDRWRGCNAYRVDGRGTSVVFGGDTARTRALEGAGPTDLTILGIGAHDPWERAHTTPEQAWAMALGMVAERVMGVHHSTNPMSDEARDEPTARLLAAAGGERWRVVGEGIGAAWRADAGRR